MKLSVCLMCLCTLSFSVQADPVTVNGYQAVTDEYRSDDNYWVYDWENQLWIPNEEHQIEYQHRNDFQQSPLKRNLISNIFGLVQRGFTSRQGGLGGLGAGSSLVGIGLGAAAAGAAVVQSQQLNDLDDAKNKLQSDLATANTRLTTAQGQISTLQTRTNACSALDCAGPLTDGCTNGACTCGGNAACTAAGGSNICTGGTCKCGLLPTCSAPNTPSTCVSTIDGISAALPGVTANVACGCAVDTDCTGSSNRCNGGFCACGAGVRECGGVTAAVNNPAGPDPTLGLNCVRNTDGSAALAGVIAANIVCGCLNNNECTGTSNRCVNGVCVCGANVAGNPPGPAACAGATPVCSNAQNAFVIGDPLAAIYTCKCKSDDQCFPRGNRCVNGACQCAGQGQPCAAGTNCRNPAAAPIPISFASGSLTSVCAGCLANAIANANNAEMNDCGGSAQMQYCGTPNSAGNAVGVAIPQGECGRCQMVAAGGMQADSACTRANIDHADCLNRGTSCGGNAGGTPVCCQSGECAALASLCSF